MQYTFHVKFNLFLIIAVFLFVFGYTEVNAAFSRSLKIGSRGSDVLELQKMLNSDPDTRVSEYGVGSPGYETDFFGNLTKKAVISFQNKYKSEVLSPIGLSYGTGFVGSMTLSKLNSLASGVKKAEMVAEKVISEPVKKEASIKTSSVKPFSGTDIYKTDRNIASVQAFISKKVEDFQKTGVSPEVDTDSLFKDLNVMIFTLSAYQGFVGEEIFVNGVGYDTVGPNTVHFGEVGQIEGIKTNNSSSLSFKVPDLPKGRYPIVISSGKGITNSSFFVIRDKTVPDIKIYSIEPSSVSFGDEVTITGSGFTKENNEVRTSYGNIGNLYSSDGKAIKFKVEPESMRHAIVEEKRVYGKKMEISVFVVNENGIGGDGVPLLNLNF